MKKLIYFLIIAAFFIATKAWAQPRCASDEVHQVMLQLHPELLENQHKVDSIINKSQFERSDDTTVYYIPIVFHVIHNYGAEDIPDAQIYDEVRILNEDYRRLNPDTNYITDGFSPLSTDARIQFVLANRDPNGNVTNGIEHIQSLKTYLADDNSKLNPWPRDYYLNVWVVSSIGAYVLGGEVLGYAHFPQDVPGLGALVDGVILISNSVGSIGTGTRQYNGGDEFFRTLTHEIGHTMSLQHPWGSVNPCGVKCGSCSIADVPVTAGYFSVCDTGKRNGGNERCTPGVHENVQNFMDYSGCSCMFTPGQVEAMRSVLQSDVDNRDSLWQPANLAFTGVLNNPPTPWAPKADFFSPTPLVCLGDTVTLVNMSWRTGGTVIYINDTITTVPLNGINWVLDNSAAASSTTDSVIKVVFNTPGWHSVSLLVSNDVGTDTFTRQSYIYVSSGTSEYSESYIENFEDQNRFNNDWLVLNPSNNTSKWQYSSAGYTRSGSSSVEINNFGNSSSDVDELIGPSIDLSADAGGTEYFYFSYAGATDATVATQMTDSLKLFYSIDCGKTWTKFSLLSGPQLATDGFDFEPYVPANDNSWKTVNIVLPQQALSSNVRFKFQFKSSGTGNNIFLDNVGVSDVAGINNVAAATVNMQLFPNPSSGAVLMVYQLTQDSPVKIELYDELGRMINLLADTKQTTGSHQLTLNSDGSLQDGIYIVHVTAANQTISKRLVITH